MNSVHSLEKPKIELSLRICNRCGEVAKARGICSNCGNIVSSHSFSSMLTFVEEASEPTRIAGAAQDLNLLERVLIEAHSSSLISNSECLRHGCMHNPELLAGAASIIPPPSKASEDSTLPESGAQAVIETIDSNKQPVEIEKPRSQFKAVSVVFGAAFDERVVTARPGKSSKPEENSAIVSSETTNSPNVGKTINLPPLDLLSNAQEQADSSKLSISIDSSDMIEINSAENSGAALISPNDDMPDPAKVMKLSRAALGEFTGTAKNSNRDTSSIAKEAEILLDTLHGDKSASGFENFKGDDRSVEYDEPEGMRTSSRLRAHLIAERDGTRKLTDTDNTDETDRDNSKSSWQKARKAAGTSENNRKSGKSSFDETGHSDETKEKSHKDRLSKIKRKASIIGAGLLGVFLLAVALLMHFDIEHILSGTASPRHTGLDADTLHPELRHLAAPEVHGWWKVTMWIEKNGRDEEFFSFISKVDQHHTLLSGTGVDKAGEFALEGRLTMDDSHGISFSKTYIDQEDENHRIPINFSGALHFGQGDSIASGEFSAVLKQSGSAIRASRSRSVQGTWVAHQTKGPGHLERLSKNLSFTTRKKNKASSSQGLSTEEHARAKEAFGGGAKPTAGNTGGGSQGEKPDITPVIVLLVAGSIMIYMMFQGKGSK